MRSSDKWTSPKKTVKSFTRTSHKTTFKINTKNRYSALSQESSNSDNTIDTKNPTKATPSNSKLLRKIPNASKSMIMNLSKRPLTDIKKTVLELVLSFSPSQKYYDKQQFCTDFYRFIRSLKLTEYFHDKDDTDSYSDTETETTLDNEIWQKKNRDWYLDKAKENRSNGLTSFIDNMTRDIKHSNMRMRENIGTT